MRPIHQSLRSEMEDDPFYRRCCVTHSSAGKIDWHHNLIYAGRQVNEKWCILPLSRAVHDIEKRSDVKEKLDWIMLNRGTDEELRRYSKAVDLIIKRNRLNKKYGQYRGERVDL